MIGEAELYQRLSEDDVTIAFDTSVTSKKSFRKICRRLNEINYYRERIGHSQRITLCVPIVAHTEQLFHLAQGFRVNYDSDVIDQFLTEENITTPDFTRADAEHCADLLQQRYETGQQWQAFKKRRALQCAGLPAALWAEAIGTGQTCGAPNDWLIIAQAHRREMILVMEDLGKEGEFNRLTNLTRFEPLRAVVERLLGEVRTML